MMVIENKFNIGELVYLKTDREQLPRIITGMCIRTTSFTYNLSSGTNESWHYELEITSERDVLISTS